ncbi:GNAT family N-acetyltransferase [Litoreibacter janthinus]|uniref:Acetyltransferase (GNAT) family protein n=1 Tax=Litoreibacter janthinus TaxID=670154 RepID=A0A1I6HN23_9RHOB|nr:GNAT family N-acetyltransferase [Litoreibacter janthinus]SFR55680.1 Acetyltransferase (GNAT) family protein [Litoreibacter janthinus]
MQDDIKAKAARSALITGAALVTMRDLQIGDAGWIAARHGELYAKDEGYDATFEALVMRILADFIDSRDPTNERAFIAEIVGVRLGSVFCVMDDPATARLRMFFLEPFARGSGVASQMLEAVIDHAKAVGASKLVLWTHASHVAACRLYLKRGFILTEQRESHAFGQDTVEQEFELPL